MMSERQFVQEYFNIIKKINDISDIESKDLDQNTIQTKNQRIEDIQESLKFIRKKIFTNDREQDYCSNLEYENNTNSSILIKTVESIFQDIRIFLSFLNQSKPKRSKPKKVKYGFIVPLTILLIFLSLFQYLLSIFLLFLLFYFTLKYFNVLKKERNNHRQEVQARAEIRLKELKQEHKQLEQQYCQRQEEYDRAIETRNFLQRVLNEKLKIKELERKAIKLLEEDKEHLIRSAQKELNIEDDINLEYENLGKAILEKEPIISFCGLNSEEAGKLSSTITSDRDPHKASDKSNGICIEAKNFIRVKGLDGKYKYGIYEFVSIFLSVNFLAYYKCYWDFIRGASVDIETCEYPYDSIASIGTKEKSSLNQKDPNIKRKYRDVLSITTKDGKIIYIRVDDDTKRQVNSSKKYISDINKAAQTIRFWLRTKRIDYINTKNTDIG